MSGLCRDCVHWRDRGIYDLLGMLHASDAVERTRWGVCLLTRSLGNEPRDDPDTLAFAVDEDDYESLLVTSPRFGCVQFRRIQLT